MSDPIKFDEAEMKEIGVIRDSYADATAAFGNLYIQRKQLDEVEKNLNEAYLALQKREKDLLDGIVKKYGEGNLDPKTGIFTPIAKKE
jgi:flagellar motility protein MotE (MotC chaperone)